MYRPPKGLTVETALGVPRDISNSVYVVREDKYPQTTDFCSSLPFSLIMENVGGGGPVGRGVARRDFAPMRRDT